MDAPDWIAWISESDYVIGHVTARNVRVSNDVTNEISTKSKARVHNKTVGQTRYDNAQVHLIARNSLSAPRLSLDEIL